MRYLGWNVAAITGRNMIDPNFLKYVIKVKQRQMITATPEQLSKLTAECNEALKILAEGGVHEKENATRNNHWLKKFGRQQCLD